MENMDSDDILKALEDKLNDLAFEAAKTSLAHDDKCKSNDPEKIAHELRWRFVDAYSTLGAYLCRENWKNQQQKVERRQRDKQPPFDG